MAKIRKPKRDAERKVWIVDVRDASACAIA